MEVWQFGVQITVKEKHKEYKHPFVLQDNRFFKKSQTSIHIKYNVQYGHQQSFDDEDVIKHLTFFFLHNLIACVTHYVVDGSVVDSNPTK